VASSVKVSLFSLTEAREERGIDCTGASSIKGHSFQDRGTDWGLNSWPHACQEDAL
jgi:hypothetical protein